MFRFFISKTFGTFFKNKSMAKDTQSTYKKEANKLVKAPRPGESMPSSPRWIVSTKPVQVVMPVNQFAIEGSVSAGFRRIVFLPFQVSRLFRCKFIAEKRSAYVVAETQLEIVTQTHAGNGF